MESTGIGPFEVIANLGSGPRGTVYRARHTSQGRVVAIKQLAATLAPDSPEFTRLWNEVARLRAVVSNHVATTHSVEILDGRPLIEMESLGESLEKVTIGRPLALRDAMRAIQDVLAGLKVLHDAGIIHDNLKPSNVLQDTTTGSWKISDGGTTAIEAQTSPTLLATSVLYVAPETLLRHSQPSERSDLYCVGMLSLAAMLGSDGLPEAFPQVPNISSPSRWLAWLEDPAQKALPLHQLRPETPEPISQFISKLLSKDPGARFASAFEATVELEAILQTLPAVGTSAIAQAAAGEAPTISGRMRDQDESTAWLVVTGPAGFNQRIDLSDRTYRIGRDPQNDIVLPDDSKTVSRIHAELRREGNRYTLIDLDSQNGLVLNGRRKASVQLQPGVSVKVGAYTLTFSAPVTAAELPATSAKASPVAPTSARSAVAKPAASSTAVSRVKDAASAVSAIALAWWPPKNAQEWAAVLLVPAAVIAIIVWLALPGSSPAPVGPGEVAAANPSTVAPPPTTPVPSAREQSLAQIRQWLDEKKYDAAQREIETLLLLSPQDAELLKLKEEAQAGAAAQTGTPSATSTPPPVGNTAQDKPPATSGSRGRRGTQPVGTATSTVPPRETEAERIEREAREKQKGAQKAIADGKTAEDANELHAALQAYELAMKLDPASQEAQGLFKRLRDRMIRLGVEAYDEASAYGTSAKYKQQAIAAFQKAISYLPDGHDLKQKAREGLARITK